MGLNAMASKNPGKCITVIVRWQTEPKLPNRTTMELYGTVDMQASSNMMLYNSDGKMLI